MIDWPLYESHKVVRAAKIVGVEKNHGGGRIVQKIWVRPAGEEFDGSGIDEFWPTVDEMAEKAEVGGWAILYRDGFKSISPAQAFEEGYFRLPARQLILRVTVSPEGSFFVVCDQHAGLLLCQPTLSAALAETVPALKELLDAGPPHPDPNVFDGIVIS